MDIVKARPEYKDAPDLLVRALRPTPPPKPQKKPLFAGLVPLYLKAAGALAVCIMAGLVRVHSGNGGLGATIGFYLGTGVVLGVALIVIELLSEMIAGSRGAADSGPSASTILQPKTGALE